MRNVKSVSKRTSGIGATVSSMPLYYSVRDDAVYTEPSRGRFFITDLIRPNSEREIINAVKYFLSL